MAMDANYCREKAALCLRLADGRALNNPGRCQLMDLAEASQRRAKELEIEAARDATRVGFGSEAYIATQTIVTATGMSALCQKWTHTVQQFRPLFDHLVGNSHHTRRNCKAQRLGRLEVDHKSVPRGLLERQL